MFRVVPQLTVKDITLAREFYTSHLGFSVTQEDPAGAAEFVALEREEVALFLVSQASREEPAQVQDLARNKRGVGVRLYFEVDDARQTHDTLRSAGVTINRELTYSQEEDYTEFSILDPDGYEIGIYS